MMRAATESQRSETKREEAHSRELRIVLLGGRWGGKSSAGNTIMGRIWFKSGRQRTVKSENQHSQVAGRLVTVVDTPGWRGYFSLKDTTEKDKEEIKSSVCYCLPGPHAFLLIVPLDTLFTEDHRTALVEHLKLLGDRVWRYSMVLFTCGDWLKDRTIKQHIETEGKALQWLVDKCMNRYHVFNNRNRDDDTQVRELLEKIEEMVAGNSGGHYDVERSVRQAMREKKKVVEEKAKKRMIEVEKQREELRTLVQEVQVQLIEVRAVLLGSQNAGKSATGNTILGSEEFDVIRGTSKSVVKHGQVNGTAVSVVDTPGWWRHYFIKDSPEMIKQEVQCSVFLCPPGPHVFLLVIDTDVLFTERQRRALEEHLELLGGHVWRHTMVLFTKADCLGTTSIEQYIEGEGQALQELVEKCGNRYHTLTNKNRGEQSTEVKELLQKIEEMVAGNRGCHYEVDETILQTIEQKRKEVEEKAKQRLKRMKEQRERLQTGLKGLNYHLPEVRLVLLGQEGAGKNVAGGTLLGREVFPTCETTQYTAYTERHWRALQDHISCLGENVWRHTIVLFSYGERLRDTNIEEHIEREGWFLQRLVDKCGNRYHVSNSKIRGDGTQVKQLLETVEEMVAENDGQHFSPDRSQVEKILQEKFKGREAEEMRLRFEEEWRRREDELMKQVIKPLMERFRKSLMELEEEINSGPPVDPKSRHVFTSPTCEYQYV
ncbi:GTPase IMAP family member 8-like [Megalops cyprinoides]|uniref:GTPase IMAP family member 8-like n=1 Tax=Megalops cyprinoides TaxID=118141 RepID=UPI001864CB2A|nr:GTPase IMAP family member 8-like [Megalops cyprinoides]